MTRTVYLNGEFVPEDEARIPIMDRGLLFADAIYEGMGVLDGGIVDVLRHLARLRRSLAEVGIPEPHTEEELLGILMELVRRNDVDEGFLYLHVTRGVAERNYVPAAGLIPTVFGFTQPLCGAPADAEPAGLTMSSQPDLRWARRDIKTTNLLGQVLANWGASEAGADEALLVAPDGTVTEGGSVSFFPVVDRTVLVRPLSQDILPGVTRSTLLEVLEAEGIPIDECTYTLGEVLAADEAMITGASSYVDPIVAIDGQAIGTGLPGNLTLHLRSTYLALVRSRLRSD
ncbi:MAG: aminotransferase class IV [Acidimicrobiales bacterium]|nr:aminotransferase class IV [Acidimicrobiales bacterium]